MGVVKERIRGDGKIHISSPRRGALRREAIK